MAQPEAFFPRRCNKQTIKQPGVVAHFANNVCYCCCTFQFFFQFFALLRRIIAIVAHLFHFTEMPTECAARYERLKQKQNKNYENSPQPKKQQQN